MSPHSGLNQNLLDNIISIIRQRKVKKIVLFGSWARKTARRTSDIDLAIFEPGLSDTQTSLIRDELEEKVKTPLKFDVVHFDTLQKESLKNEILTEGIVIYESRAN